MKNYLAKARLLLSDWRIRLSSFSANQKTKKVAKIISIILCTEIVLLGVLFLIPSTAFSQINTDQLIQLTNAERERFNLPPLTYNKKLTKAAENKARDIFKKDYFSHTTPAGKVFSEWIKEADYWYLYAGENLAIGFATNEGTVAAWMRSGKHRENILGKQYEEIGLAAVEGEFNDQKTTVIVQLFGTPR